MTKRLDDDFLKATETYHDRIQRADFDTILGSLGFSKPATSSLIDRKLQVELWSCLIGSKQDALVGNLQQVLRAIMNLEISSLKNETNSLQIDDQ